MCVCVRVRVRVRVWVGDFRGFIDTDIEDLTPVIISYEQ